MADRVREKAKRASARQGDGSSAGDSSTPTAGQGAGATTLEARVRALESERDALRGELETARARIAALEESRSQVASRIDWVIDNLSSLTGSNE